MFSNVTAGVPLSPLHREKRGQQIRQALQDAGVELICPFAGLLKTDAGVAAIEIEADDCIRVKCDLSTHPVGLTAIRRHAALLGNARLARAPTGFSALAETCLDGVDHLPESFEEIRCDFSRLADVVSHVDRDTEDERNPPRISDGTTLEATIQQSDVLRDEAVEVESGWELRPRVAATVVPVSVQPLPGGIRVAATVLAAVPGETGEAIADIALRLNAQLRLARFALLDGALVAESRLRDALIQCDWLETAARAVAAAWCAAAPRVAIIAEQPSVAEQYTKLFLGNVAEKRTPFDSF